MRCRIGRARAREHRDRQGPRDDRVGADEANVNQGRASATSCSGQSFSSSTLAGPAEPAPMFSAAPRGLYRSAVPQTAAPRTIGPSIGVNSLTKRRRSLVARRTQAATTLSTLDAQIAEIDRQLAQIFAGPSRLTAESFASTRAPKAAAGPERAAARRPTGSARPNPTADKILSALRRKRGAKGLSPTEIAEATDINTALVSKTLQRLVQRGRIEHVGRGAYRVPR